MALEPKTARELQRLLADHSGISSEDIIVQRRDKDDSFFATVIAGPAVVRDRTVQSKIETICEHLRLKYRLISRFQVGLCRMANGVLDAPYAGISVEAVDVADAVRKAKHWAASVDVAGDAWLHVLDENGKSVDSFKPGSF